MQTFGETEVPYTSTTTHLNRPYSLAVDNANNVYVGEVDGTRVLKFNASGVFQAQIGYTSLCYVWDDAGSGICGANGLAVAPDGNVWIAEEGPDRVSVFTYTTTAFTYTNHLGVTWNSGDDNDHFNNPEGVAFDSAGRIYVADRENHRVQVFTNTGAYSATLGSGVCGSGNYEFCYPYGLAVGNGDVLYVADSDNYRVQIYRRVGDSLVYSQSITTTGTSDLGWVTGVAVNANYVYIADDSNSQVHVFSRGGVYSSTIDGDCGGSNDWFCWPRDVAVDASGNVYVADTWDGFRVMQCTGGPSWTCDTFAGTQDVPYITDNYHYFRPTGIAVDGTGNIFLTEGPGRRLIKLNSSGTPQWSVGEPGIYGSDTTHFGWPEQVAYDGNGRLYVADADNHRVQIFNSNGSYFTTLGNEDCNPGNGIGNTEFCSPRGVAVGGNGRIYVADTDNHRVQVFDSNRNWVATLGASGESGDDNSHFNYPRGVTVDASNNVYVADGDNRRVQKCTVVGTGGTCTLFAGVTGEWGDDFAHLGYPADVAAVGGKVFVADCDNNRVQVFDSSGAYLTTIGGSWGSRTGELRGTYGVDVDSAGNVYVTDADNSRIQKYAPGVPGWAQVNINGFGDRTNETVHRMSVFSSALYISTVNYNAGGELWRSTDGTSWSQVNSDGFGVISNMSALVGEGFNGYLYVGTWNDAQGGEIWRCAKCDGTDWQQVVSGGFGDSDNTSVERIAAFSNTLYATTNNWDTGAEVWKSSTGAPGSWTQANADGFDDAQNVGLWAVAVFNGYLYAATYQGDSGTPTGLEVWRTNDGATWHQVNNDGFGDPNNIDTWLEPFKGYLYALSGTQLWRCDVCNAPGDWEQVVSNGIGVSDNPGNVMVVFGDNLYVSTGNDTTGVELWRTANGSSWSQANIDGFGDSNNARMWYGGVVFNNRLYVGTGDNWANGGEVWSMGGGQVYLPIVLKNYR